MCWWNRPTYRVFVFPGPRSWPLPWSPALNLYFPALALNIYLLAPALNLFIPDLALSLGLPVHRFTVKVCYSDSVYLYVHYICLRTFFLSKLWEKSKLQLFEISSQDIFSIFLIF